MNDHELIVQITQHNDHSAFATLVDRYQRMVVNTCRGFVSSYADAEDLAQEVFIELFESLPEFRNESKLSTWIYRIAVNKSLNFIRKNKRQSVFSSFSSLFETNDRQQPKDFNDPISSDEADRQVNSTELHKALKDAINRLPKNQRIAFILNKYQDLSYKEVAEVMDVSLSSVESLLFRAKMNLQQLLSGFYNKNEN
jgi:RNA polymerase sigma-70 factor (ECF subfamily)